MTLVLFFTLGAACAMALGVAAIILGLQWVTTYPYRLGWRAHSGPIGKQISNGDPRLRTRSRPGGSRLISV